MTVTLQCKGLCWLRSHDCTAGVLFPGLEKDKRGAEEETAAHLSAVHTAEGALGPEQGGAGTFTCARTTLRGGSRADRHVQQAGDALLLPTASL